jgi:hypothetical protein
VSVIKFGADGQPTEKSTSTSALSPIVANSDVDECPGKCFRPAGLAWDTKGRLYMSSDTTGEIYVIVKSGGKALDTNGKASAASVSTGFSTAGLFVALMASVFAYFM